MSEAQKIGRIFDLESDNAMLRLKIKEIMEDYHKRLEVINHLKDSSSGLNLCIQGSKEHTRSLKEKSEHYQEKFEIKEL
jgi:hypothetical protein